VASRPAELEKACNQIAATLKVGVKITVSMIPGGMASILISDLAEGAFDEALFDAIPLLQLNKIGATALKFVFNGGGEVKVAAPVVKVLYEMGPEEKQVLKEWLSKNAKSAKEMENCSCNFWPNGKRCKRQLFKNRPEGEAKGNRLWYENGISWTQCCSARDGNQWYRLFNKWDKMGTKDIKLRVCKCS
jgi:hypothetical protein